MRDVLRKTLLFAVLAAVPAGALAAQVRLPEGKFDLDPTHSTVGFSIEFMGLTRVEGRFTNYNGTILYDDADLTRSSVTVLINADSIYTASDFRDRHLKTADFFDVEKFPLIKFQSTRMEKAGDQFIMHGDLTIKNVTRPVAIPFQQVHGRMKDIWQNTRVGFQGKLKIDRRDFGVVATPRWESVLDAGRLTIGHEVEITLNIQGRIWNMELINIPEKSVARVLEKTIAEQGIAAAVQQYHELKSAGGDTYDFGPVGVNRLAYRLLYAGKKKEAFELFKLNADAHPGGFGVHDSLGEAYAVMGDRARAIEHYRRSLELEPRNASAMEMLRYLGDGTAAGAGR